MLIVSIKRYPLDLLKLLSSVYLLLYSNARLDFYEI